MYPGDIWLKVDFPSKLPKNHIFQKTWQPSWSGVRFNIACYKKSKESMLIECLDTIRKIRVGDDARYAHVSVWLDFHSISDGILSTLSKVDTFIPRLRIYIIYIPQNIDITKVRQFWSRLKDYRLSVKILFLLSEDNNGLKNCKYLMEDISGSDFAENIVVECFPSSNDINSSEVINLVNMLNTYNYNFGKHPLSLCGIVSHTCKTIFLSHFKNYNTKNSNYPQISPFSDIEQLACSYECLKHCVSKETFLYRLHCCCGYSVSDIQIGEGLKESISISLYKSDDRILFEDWQYIYDGFEMA